jgi:O-antigen/teichoic acid export membrane protein
VEICFIRSLPRPPRAAEIARNMTTELSQWVSAKRDELIPEGSLQARFALGAFWSIAGSVISRGFTLVASIVCARLLGKMQFGELGMIQSTVGVFGLFAGLALGLTATKYVAEFRDRDPEKVGRILALSSLVAFFSSAAMALLLIFAAPFLAGKTLASPDLASPLALASGLVFFGALNGAQTGALAGFEAFRTIAAVNIFSGVTSFPLVVMGVWKWGVKGAVGGLVAAMALNWLFNNWAIRKECRRANIKYDFTNSYREMEILHKFSLPAFLASILVGPAWWICNAYLVRQPNGYSQLGVYAAADRWRLLILFVPTSVFGMIVPVLSNLYGAGDQMGFKRVYRAHILLNSGLALIPALAMILLAAPIMALYGESFRTGWPILMILALAAVPEAMNSILGHPLIVAGAMWQRFAFDMLLAVVFMSMAFLLIPRWGAVGLAMAYFLAFSVTSLGLYIFGKMKARSRVSEGAPGGRPRQGRLDRVGPATDEETC